MTTKNKMTDVEQKWPEEWIEAVRSKDADLTKLDAECVLDNLEYVGALTPPSPAESQGTMTRLTQAVSKLVKYEFDPLYLNTAEQLKLLRSFAKEALTSPAAQETKTAGVNYAGWYKRLIQVEKDNAAFVATLRAIKKECQDETWYDIELMVDADLEKHGND